MSATGGGDEPEAQEIAMYHAVTGEAFSTPVPIAKHTPAPGTSGGVDFRPGSLEIVVSITDAHWHDDIDIPWSTGSYMDLNRLIKVFKAANAKFVAVEEQHSAAYETTPYPFDHQPQLFSDATKSNIPPAAFGGKCGAGQCCTN